MIAVCLDGRIDKAPTAILLQLHAQDNFISLTSILYTGDAYLQVSNSI